MATTEPVHDWLSDYDIFDPGYVRDPVPRWDELRGCPIAHTERWGGSWLPTRYEDIHAIAHDVEHFSSTQITVVPRVVVPGTEHVHAPPIDSDPPEHGWSRRLLLPSFAPRAVEKHEPGTRALCRSLIDRFIANGRGDAATDYAQQIPSRVIAELMGIPSDCADDFTVWVQGLLELGQTDIPLRLRSREALFGFLTEIIEDRQRHPRDDLITELLQSEVDGEPVPVSHVLGTCQLLIIAGIDTTWSSIGSALWHLAQHPDDRRRLAADPSCIPTAVEELLRAYSPVTMARIVREPIDFGGVHMDAGDRVLMSFPAANRDPTAFDDADQVILDRERNRHIAFGVGIHRCAGSNLARMEMRVALEEWLARIPEFSLEDPDAVTWAAGQVRGPRSIPVVFP
jgi:cytochrome P450